MHIYSYRSLRRTFTHPRTTAMFLLICTCSLTPFEPTCAAVKTQRIIGHGAKLHCRCGSAWLPLITEITRPCSFQFLHFQLLHFQFLFTGYMFSRISNLLIAGGTFINTTSHYHGTKARGETVVIMMIFRSTTFTHV